jgi:hypothetical protein
MEITADTMGNESVNACLKGVIQSIKFPPLDEEIKFSVSFIFSNN